LFTLSGSAQQGFGEGKRSTLPIKRIYRRLFAALEETAPFQLLKPGSGCAVE